VKPLDGIRVVDLGEGAVTGLAGMILGDFGAEVIRLERPGGDPWRAHAAARMTMRGQKSVTFDVDDAAMCESVRALILETADAVLSARPPSTLAAAALALADLIAARSDLVVCDVSTFGRRGPWAEAPLNEGLAAARSGRMLTFRGLVARDGPVYSALNVATHATAQTAASAVLAGLIARGGRFETSLVRGLLPYEMGGLFALQRAAADGTPSVVPDPMRIMPTINYHPVQCGDGRWLQLGNLLPHQLARFLALTGLDADVPRALRDQPPATWPTEALETFRDRMLAQMQTRTADEWMARFVADGGVVAHPYQTTREALDDPDIVANDHVVARDGIRQLGLLARLERTPGEVSFEVPTPGSTPLASLLDRHHGEAVPSRRRRSEGPLAGFTIVEFATIIAAPLGASLLADLGARVIKVEPLDGDPFRGMLNGYGAARVNAGKESIALDLKHPEGQRIARNLIGRADALVHNYRPGVPERLGIGWEQIRTDHPRLVYVTVNGYGRWGPGALRPSTHPVPGAALGGVCLQAGEPPRALGDAATLRETARRLMRANEVNPDPNTSVVVATATLLGLVARERHGVGQEIQLDMFGANAYANFDDFLDFEGMRPRRCPDAEWLGLGALERLYACAQGWIFLAAAGPGDESLLRVALGELGFRVRDHDGLDAIFALRDAEFWEHALLPRGIGCVRADAAPPAAFLLNDAMARTERLVGAARHRTWGDYLRHGRLVEFEGVSALRGSCEAGEHSRAILRELGVDEPGIDRLARSGVVLIR
jgi:crotonobetainyl-CoA:carnitine CoA-transferase CaiB-like acyl-CoA transferase